MTANSSAWYATREDVKSALDSKETARNNAAVDRALGAATQAVNSLMQRVFYPTLATKYFDWPNRQSSNGYRLWLDANELISTVSLSSGGVALVEGTDYYLEPVNYGPPFNRVEINQGGDGSFNSGPATYQRSISITGLFGYNLDESAISTLSGSINSSTSAVTLGTGVGVGVGSVVRVGTERMVVTERSFVSTDTLSGNLTAQNSATGIVVTTGSAFSVGDVILVGAEKMLITDIGGNTLVVKRAWDGSVLATHSTSDVVYSSRGFTVQRSALGTTATSHTNGDAAYIVKVPQIIRELTVAEAVNYLQNEGGGWSGSNGPASNPDEVSGKGLSWLRDVAMATYARKGRTRVI